MLKARILTACVLIPAVFWCLFFASPFVFLIATVTVLMIGAWEWSRLMGLTHLGARLLYFYMICIFQVAALLVYPLWVLSASVLWWVIALMLIIQYPQYKRWNTVLMRGLMGIVVLVPCVVALNVIRSWEYGNQVLLFLLLLIWIADIAAFFVGRRFGVTKLAPNVSPGKSVQGLWGALCATFLFSSLVIYFYDDHINYLNILIFIGLSLLCVLFSVVGDLFESMIKREAGVKDSGTLLPGHGGVLDRIDSLTAAAPFFAASILLIRHFAIFA